MASRIWTTRHAGLLRLGAATPGSPSSGTARTAAVTPRPESRARSRASGVAGRTRGRRPTPPDPAARTSSGPRSVRTSVSGTPGDRSLTHEALDFGAEPFERGWGRDPIHGLLRSPHHGMLPVPRPLGVREQVFGRRELEDPSDLRRRLDEPELLAPVVSPVFEVHHRDPGPASHERDVSQVHDDIELLRDADQVEIGG